jgi:hypothetical protein
MQDIADITLLTVPAVLGCFSFVELFTGKQNVTTWEQVAATAGVTAFLSAVGFVLERGWMAAALLAPAHLARYWRMPRSHSSSGK